MERGNPHRNRPIKEEIKDQLVNGEYGRSSSKPTPLERQILPRVAASWNPHAFDGDLSIWWTSTTTGPV
ncbi:MAG: hypothetical protein ACLR6J_12325 [Parabacteroides merdae]